MERKNALTVLGLLAFMLVSGYWVYGAIIMHTVQPAQIIVEDPVNDTYADWELVPSMISFPNILVGGVSDPVEVAVTNNSTSTQTLHISDNLPEGFTLVKPDAFQVDAGETVYIYLSVMADYTVSSGVYTFNISYDN